MSLELILGPMFAGKSTEAIRRIRTFQSEGLPYLVITSTSDTRYDPTGKSINTHSRVSVPAIALASLQPLLSMDEFEKATYIVIEEAQFFPDLYDTVMEMVEKRRKYVFVFGLDGDSERRPFGQVVNLIPVADTYIKLKAECRLCDDRKAALFTKRLSAYREQVCVGGDETYQAVCRNHYLEPMRV